MRPFDADQRKQWDPKTARLAALPRDPRFRRKPRPDSRRSLVKIIHLNNKPGAYA
jgi:hypothetical protein